MLSYSCGVDCEFFNIEKYFQNYIFIVVFIVIVLGVNSAFITWMKENEGE